MKTIAILLLVMAASFSLAADPAVKGEVTPAVPGADVRPSVKSSPMMLEIQETLETARLRVAELQRLHDAAVNDEEALEIVREAARVKRESRIEMMRIQLRYARAEGRAETAAELEEIITKMTTPPAPGVPVQRRPNHQ